MICVITFLIRVNLELIKSDYIWVWTINSNCYNYNQFEINDVSESDWLGLQLMIMLCTLD